MKCRTNDIYMYVIFVVVVVFTGIVILNKPREGLENDDKTKTTIQDIVSKLKKESELLEDTLLIDKHRSDYEDMFLALEDYSNLAIIQLISVFSNNPSLEKESAKKMIEGINHINTLKSTLNDVMEFMDRKRTSSKTDKSFFGN